MNGDNVLEGVWLPRDEGVRCSSEGAGSGAGAGADATRATHDSRAQRAGERASTTILTLPKDGWCWCTRWTHQTPFEMVEYVCSILDDRSNQAMWPYLRKGEDTEVQEDDPYQGEWVYVFDAVLPCAGGEFEIDLCSITGGLTTNPGPQRQQGLVWDLCPLQCYLHVDAVKGSGGSVTMSGDMGEGNAIPVCGQWMLGPGDVCCKDQDPGNEEGGDEADGAQPTAGHCVANDWTMAHVLFALAHCVATEAPTAPTEPGKDAPRTPDGTHAPAMVWMPYPSILTALLGDERIREVSDTPELWGVGGGWEARTRQARTVRVVTPDDSWTMQGVCIPEVFAYRALRAALTLESVRRPRTRPMSNTSLRLRLNPVQRVLCVSEGAIPTPSAPIVARLSLSVWVRWRFHA